MGGSLRGPRAKVERAKQHIRELEGALGGQFVTVSHVTHPNLIWRETDAEGQKTVYKVGEIPVVPDSVATIAGDAIHNLRSALDLLIAQLILAAGNIPRDEYFPIAASRKKFKSRCATEIKGRVGQDALDFVIATEAYRGGKGDPLWRIHRLDIEDKHRLLFLFGVIPRSQTLTFPSESMTVFPPEARTMLAEMMGDLFMRPADRPILKKGDPLYFGPPKEENEPKFRLEIAFGESQIVQGEPVLTTLLGYTQFTEETLKLFGPFLPASPD